MVHINECVYISDYLEGGLTKSGRRMKMRSPRGMMARSWEYLIDSNVNWKTKIKMAILYDIYSGISNVVELTEEERSRRHFLITIFKLPGAVLCWVWKRKYGQTGIER